MSTVLGFPAATVPTPETSILWTTEGSGATRDKKVAAGTLVADLLGRAVNSQAAAAAPIAGATDLLPVSRGNTGGKASVDAVVGAGFAGALPTAVGALTAASALDGTETLPVVQTTAKKLTTDKLVPQIMDIPLTAITLKRYDGGVDITADLVDTGVGSNLSRIRLALEDGIGGQVLTVDAHLTLDGQSDSASNTGTAEIEIDWASLPEPFLSLSGIGWPRLIGTTFHATFKTVTVSSGVGNTGYFFYDPAGSGTYKWQDLAPNNGVDLQIHFSYVAILVP